MKTMKTSDTRLARVYWGNQPLPQGAELLGTVTRSDGSSGALLRMRTGQLAQGNAGCVRTLPLDATHIRRGIQNGGLAIKK